MSNLKVQHQGSLPAVTQPPHSALRLAAACTVAAAGELGHSISRRARRVAASVSLGLRVARNFKFTGSGLPTFGRPRARLGSIGVRCNEARSPGHWRSPWADPAVGLRSKTERMNQRHHDGARAAVTYVYAGCISGVGTQLERAALRPLVTLVARALKEGSS